MTMPVFLTFNVRVRTKSVAEGGEQSGGAGVWFTEFKD